jgi:hypothetical protein
VWELLANGTLVGWEKSEISPSGRINRPASDLTGGYAAAQHARGSISLNKIAIMDWKIKLQNRRLEL